MGCPLMSDQDDDVDMFVFPDVDEAVSKANRPYFSSQASIIVRMSIPCYFVKDLRYTLGMLSAYLYKLVRLT